MTPEVAIAPDLLVQCLHHSPAGRCTAVGSQPVSLPASSPAENRAIPGWPKITDALILATLLARYSHSDATRAPQSAQ